MTSQENLHRIFRLQKRAARVILNVKVKEERTTTLFNRLNWIPFYDEANVNKCCIIYKSLHGTTPDYLSNKLVKVSDIFCRTSRYGDLTLQCPNFLRKTEGGKTFLASTIKLWNTLPIEIRRSNSINVFKRQYLNLLKDQYKDLDHFSIS